MSAFEYSGHGLLNKTKQNTQDDDEGTNGHGEVRAPAHRTTMLARRTSKRLLRLRVELYSDKDRIIAGGTV